MFFYIVPIDVMFVTPEGLNTMTHVTNNTSVTQWMYYRMTLISVELTPRVGVGTRYSVLH